MCGILFISQKKPEISIENFKKTLKSQSWRGPDNTSYLSLFNNHILLGHNRLSILDTKSRSNQPMLSKDGRYAIIFNGEIYNYKEIIKKYNLKLNTSSDTEVILKGFIKIGKKILNEIDGMFSFLIYDKQKSKWLCARDRFGIKPLFIYQDKDKTVVGSEAGSIAKLLNLKVDTQSILEWKLLRSTTPQFTYFKKLHQFPKSCYKTDQSEFIPYYNLKKSKKKYNFNIMRKLINNSIKTHQMGDVKCTSLLSGGIDSSIVLSKAFKVKNCYSVGLKNNNEFILAKRISKKLKKKISLVKIKKKELISSWKYLTKLRGEPLSVPNEGLIYLVCRKMKKEHKIVLTGEGADEIFFGYDNIFRWALNQKSFNFKEFLEFYSYSNNIKPTQRFKKYVFRLKTKKKKLSILSKIFFMIFICQYC